MWILGICFYSFSGVLVSQKRQQKREEQQKATAPLPLSLYIKQHFLLWKMLYLYVLLIRLYVYVIGGRLYYFKTQGKCEILQRERELVRVFLAQFFF